MPCSGTYLLEVSARVSLKIAYNGFFRAESTLKIAFLKILLKRKKLSVTTNTIYVFLVIFEHSYLAQLNILWKRVRRLTENSHQWFIKK